MENKIINEVISVVMRLDRNHDLYFNLEVVDYGFVIKIERLARDQLTKKLDIFVGYSELLQSKIGVRGLIEDVIIGDPNELI